MTAYDGGKGGAGVAQWIINQIPPHRVYIEPFVGAGAVQRFKAPARIAIVVDIDEQVIATHWADTRDLIVIHGDALEYLRGYAYQGDEFVYCDPPYLMETRSCQRPLYAHEFATIEQHRALLTLLERLPCMVAISGYWSALYALELASWRSDTFQTVNRAGKSTTEWLWMNYPPPLELHDYRYLGKNFRERERIKRKKTRWTKRLREMPELERLCLMEAIGALRAGIVAHGDVDDHQGASLETAMTAAIAKNDDAGGPASTDLTMLQRRSQ
jgi:hypothetical protein